MDACWTDSRQTLSDISAKRLWTRSGQILSKRPQRSLRRLSEHALDRFSPNELRDVCGGSLAAFRKTSPKKPAAKLEEITRSAAGGQSLGFKKNKKVEAARIEPGTSRNPEQRRPTGAAPRLGSRRAHGASGAPAAPGPKNFRGKNNK